MEITRTRCGYINVISKALMMEAQISRIKKQLEQRISYRTRLTSIEISKIVSEILSEKIAFGGLRYEGIIENNLFTIKDTIVTKTRTPPLVKGVVSEQGQESLVIISFEPSTGTILRFATGILAFVAIMIFANEGEATSITSRLGFATIFSAGIFVIVYLNLRDSIKRSREYLEKKLMLRRS